MTDEEKFKALLEKDVRNERRILWSEVALILAIAAMLTAYSLMLLATGTA